MQIIVTCRAVIIHQNKLLICRHNDPGRSFYNLPGGKLDPGETIEAGMERELLEETGVKPKVGGLLFVNQLINASDHRIEFFFNIENGADYADFDPAKASHDFEVANFVFADPTDPQYDLKPSFLKDRFADLLSQGHGFPTEIIVSS